MEQAGIDVNRIRNLLRSAPEVLAYALEEMTEELADHHGLDSAEVLANILLEEIARVAPAWEVSADIERDDYEVVERELASGKKKQVRRLIKGGNIKELVRKLRLTLPATKFLSIDDAAREYLLYCLI